MRELELALLREDSAQRFRRPHNDFSRKTRLPSAVAVSLKGDDVKFTCASELPDQLGMILRGEGHDVGRNQLGVVLLL